MLNFTVHDADIKLLKVFRAVVQYGGFSAAQAALNTSQSTISTNMAQLEQRLGMRLCDRGIKGFQLTPEGEMVVEAVDRVFSALEDFRTDIGEVRGRIEGEIRIGFSDNIALHPQCKVIDALGELTDISEHIDLDLFIGSPQQLEGRLLDGRLHVVVGCLLRQLEQISYTEIFREEQRLFVGAGHPLFARDDDDIDVKEIEAERHSGNRSLAFAQQTPDVRFVSNSPFMEGLLACVLSDRYLSYLPAHYAAPSVERGRMRAIKPDIYSWSVPVFIACKHSQRRPKLVSVFLELLNKHHGSNAA